MKRKLMKNIRTLAALGLALVMLAGCGSSGQETKESASTPASEEKAEAESSQASEETIHLTIHTCAPEQADQAQVIEALNEYTKEKLNITADWYFHGGAYADKMQVIISSGEEYDICFTSNWLNNYNDNVAKGAYVNLKDMLQEVTPDLYAELPEYLWSAATINGGIYAIPNQQIVARQQCIIFPTEFVEATGVNIEEISNLTNIIDYAQKAYDLFGAKVASIKMNEAADYTGYEWINAYTSAGAIKMGDSGVQVVNFYETDEWISMLEEQVVLNELGLLDGEAGYNEEYWSSQRTAKKLSAIFSGTYKPGVEADATMISGYDCLIGKIDLPPYISTGSIVATMSAISNTSKHQEAALKYLELINTDSYAMNLISYGIEGEHYTKLEDNVIEVIADGGYSHGYSWAFGNVFNTYAVVPQTADVHELTKQQNDSGVSSPLLGFTFDAEPVKLQIANVTTVVNEYESILGGNLPVQETNAEFVEKLKVAGVDEIIAEMQKQADAFLASK